MVDLKNRGRRNKRQELLERIITFKPEVLRELAEYLVKEKDDSLLDDVLDGLDAAWIRRDPSDTAQYETTVLQPTLKRILQVSAILNSLALMKGSASEANSIKDRCLQTLLERWGAVTTWISHLLTEKLRPNPWDSVMTLYQWIAFVSIDLLVPLVSEIDGNRYKEELISMPATIDFLVTLVCSTNPRTGKYCDIVMEGKDSCSLLQKVWYPITTSIKGRERFIERLSNCAPKYQKKVAKAFASRARAFTETLQTEIQLNGAIRSLVTLFNISSSLSWAAYFGTGTSIWPLLNRQNFLHEYASALFKVTEKGKELKIANARFWSSVNQCTTTLTLMAVFAAPNPINVLPRVIEGGLLPCILASIPKTVEYWPPASHPFAIEPLRMLYPFLYVEKIYAALESAGDLDLMDAWNDTASKTPAKEIFDEWKHLLWRGIKAYDDRREHEELRINMCNNGKCPLHLVRKGMGTIHPKTCSSCHTATYCSKECQAEDWLAFHAAECAGLAHLYQGHQLEGRWPSWRTRRDQLIFLQFLANTDLPDLPELKEEEAPLLSEFASEPEPMSAPTTRPHFDSDLGLTFVDLVTERRLVVLPGISIAHLNHSGWARLNGALDRRIEACVRDLERNRNTILLVEAKFPLDEQYVMWVFVKMEWSSEAPETERYRIVSHAFRLGIYNWNEEETPWLFQRNQQLQDLGNIPLS